MKTIVVDDESLQLGGFRYESEDIPEIELVGCFDSPLEALDFAERSEVELAFLDIRMPEMDGFELAKRLRRLYPDIKVIALTASEEHEGMHMEGMDDIILKPYSKKELERALLQLTKNVR